VHLNIPHTFEANDSPVTRWLGAINSEFDSPSKTSSMPRPVGYEKQEFDKVNVCIEGMIKQIRDLSERIDSLPKPLDEPKILISKQGEDVLEAIKSLQEQLGRGQGCPCLRQQPIDANGDSVETRQDSSDSSHIEDNYGSEDSEGSEGSDDSDAATFHDSRQGNEDPTDVTAGTVSDDEEQKMLTQTIAPFLGGSGHPQRPGESNTKGETSIPETETIQSNVEPIAPETTVSVGQIPGDTGEEAVQQGCSAGDSTETSILADHGTGESPEDSELQSVSLADTTVESPRVYPERWETFSKSKKKNLTKKWRDGRRANPTAPW
jgi:hypothetical protein